MDRDAAADLGVAPASVAGALNTLFNGTTVGQYEDQGDRIDVTVSVEDGQSAGLDSVDGIYLASRTTGSMVPIEQLTKKEYTTGSSKLERYDKSRDVQVQTNFIGISSSELSAAFMEKLNAELPPPRKGSRSTRAETIRKRRIQWSTWCGSWCWECFSSS